MVDTIAFGGIIVRMPTRASTRVRAKNNPHAVALSKLGASKGGLARAASLSARRRQEIASKAAKARWAKRKDK